MTSSTTHKPRKSRSGSETRKRKSPISFRASDEEQAIIEAAADRAGLTVSSYVRSRALAKPTTRAVRRPPVATAQLAQLLGMLGAVAGEVQRIARLPDASDSGTEMQTTAALAALRQAASAILQVLGKRPHDY